MTLVAHILGTTDPSFLGTIVSVHIFYFRAHVKYGRQKSEINRIVSFVFLKNASFESDLATILTLCTHRFHCV